MGATHNNTNSMQLDSLAPNSMLGRYRVSYPIAEGTFGRVYLCTYGGRNYAMKQVRQPSRQNHRQQMENEIRVLVDMNHENIVRLHEVIRDRDYVYLVMEYCQSDLREYLGARSSGLDESECYNILGQLVRGLGQLVGNHIVHRDLKPANVLCQGGVFKLADFGLAKYIEDQCQLLKTRVGTPYYMAPQILRNETYTSKCDIWSLGIIFYQLVFGSLPWHATTEQRLLANVQSIPISISKVVSPKTLRLIYGMLAIEEHQRYSWEDLVRELEGDSAGYEVQTGRSYPWGILEKLVGLEAGRVSNLSYGKKFQLLRNEEKKSVVSLTSKLFSEQHRELFSYLLKNKIKT